MGKTREELRGFENREQVDFVPPEDSLEDVILEAMGTSDVAPDKITVLIAAVRAHFSNGAETSYAAPAKMVKEALQRLAPPRASIIHWWALHFTLETKFTNTMTPGELARIMGVNVRSVHWHIAQWRKVLGITEPKARPGEFSNVTRQRIAESTRKAHNHARFQKTRTSRYRPLPASHSVT